MPIFKAGFFAICCLVLVMAAGESLGDDNLASLNTQLKQKIARIKPGDVTAQQQVDDTATWIRDKHSSESQSAVAALVALLKAVPPEVDWIQLRKSLAEHGPAADPAVIRLLSADDPMLRERAAMTLWHMGLSHRKPQDAVPALIQATADPDNGVRFWSIRALGVVDAESPDVIAALTRLLSDANIEVRREAILGLADRRTAAASAVPQLLELLRHDDVMLRSSAVFALGRIGPPAAEAAHELVQLLADATVCEEASVALARIGINEQHVPALRQLLRHDRLRSQQLAALHLATLGGGAAAAVPDLIVALENKALCEFAMHALGQIGPSSESAVPHLMQLLTTSEVYYLRAGAAEALGQIGPAAAGAIPALEAAASDDNALVRRQAQTAVRRIGCPSEKATAEPP